MADTTAALKLAREQVLARLDEDANRTRGRREAVADLTRRLLDRVEMLEETRGETQARATEWVHLVGPDELCRRVQVVRVDERYTCRTLKVPRKTLGRSLGYFEDVPGVPHTYNRWRVERLTWHLVTECRDNAKVTAEPLEARVKIGEMAPPPGGHAHPCGCRPGEKLKTEVCYCVEGPHPTLVNERTGVTVDISVSGEVGAPPMIPVELAQAAAAVAKRQGHTPPLGGMGEIVHHYKQGRGCLPAIVMSVPQAGEAPWRNLHVFTSTGPMVHMHTSFDHRAPGVRNTNTWHAADRCDGSA